jgi:flavorubredoxin
MHVETEEAVPMTPQTLPTAAHPVAADTWLIPTIAAEPGGNFVAANSLVIRGAEPVIVDTGCSLVRDAWAEQVFSVVEPEDVRWVFLSHDDHDHIGNLDVVLERCPLATVVANFSMTSRLAGDVELPFHRMRWVDAGESFDVGDRVLAAVRPPMFDSPATRGLFDATTGVLWAVDSFGALLPGAVLEADDVPRDLFDMSFVALNTWNTPWIEWVDRDRYAAHVHDTAKLGATVVASAHGPVLRGARIEDAFRRTLALAGTTPVPQPGQELLDDLLAAVLGPATV